MLSNTARHPGRFKKRNVRLAAIAVGVSLGLALSACSSGGGGSSGATASSSGPLKVAFVYNGSVTDQNWNQQAYNNQKTVEQDLGSKIQTTFVQNVAQGASVTPTLQSLISKGYKLIFMNTAGYETNVKQLAPKNPDVRFEEFESSATAPNSGMYNINIADADYIAGMMLASASKTGHLGTVASFPFPGIITQLDGLMLGARAVNPNATLKVTFLSSFYDPAKEDQAATALVNAGIDGLFNQLNDANTCQVAEKTNVPCVANTTLNGDSFGPHTYLSDARFNWTPVFEKIINMVRNGQKVPNNVFMTYQDGAAEMGPTGPSYSTWVNATDQAKITAKEAAMKNGTFTAYTGPISDQSGKVRVPAGQKLTPDQISSISWPVQGIIGSFSAQ